MATTSTLTPTAVADALIGLAISAVILKIPWDSWRTVPAATTPP